MKKLLVMCTVMSMLIACSDNSNTTQPANTATSQSAVTEAASASKPAASAAAATTNSGRDVINIVGSSTVYPFATVVAERFGKTTNFKTPKIESTGTGGGMKLFCSSIDINTPDITNASRRIKESELKMCQDNGVCLLYTSPSPRDRQKSRMPSSA